MELRKCPFCGAENAWVDEIEFYRGVRWYALCPSCGAASGFKDTRADAIEAWNRRAS